MPRTQSALLEAMAERQVTVDGVTRAAADARSSSSRPRTRSSRRARSRCPRRSSTASRCAPRSAIRRRTRRSRSSSRSATGTRSRRSQPQVDADDVDMLSAAVEDVYVDELVLALDRRPRPRDAAGRRRLDRRVRPRQPHARAHGARVGADARTRPRRPRRRRRALPPRARPPAAAHARPSSPRRARSAAPRRCETIKERCLALAPPPAPDWDATAPGVAVATQRTADRFRSSRVGGSSGFRSATSRAGGAATAAT